MKIKELEFTPRLGFPQKANYLQSSLICLTLLISQCQFDYEAKRDKQLHNFHLDLLVLNSDQVLPLICLFKVIQYAIQFDYTLHKVLKNDLTLQHLQNSTNYHIHSYYKINSKSFFNKLSKGPKQFLFHKQVYHEVKRFYFRPLFCHFRKVEWHKFKLAYQLHFHRFYKLNNSYR